MNILSQYISGIQDSIKTMFLYHVSGVVIILFTIMGSIAGFVLFFFAYSTPVLDTRTLPPPIQSVTVATSIVDTISRYASDKEKSALGVPIIPASVFFVPPAK